MPGALHGALAASAALSEGAEVVEVDDLQLHSPMVFPEDETEDSGEEAGRRIQLVWDDSEDGAFKRLEIYCRGDDDDSWTLNAEANARLGVTGITDYERVDIASAKTRLVPMDTSVFYQ